MATEPKTPKPQDNPPSRNLKKTPDGRVRWEHTDREAKDAIESKKG